MRLEAHNCPQVASLVRRTKVPKMYRRATPPARTTEHTAPSGLKVLPRRQLFARVFPSGIVHSFSVKTCCAIPVEDMVGRSTIMKPSVGQVGRSLHRIVTLGPTLALAVFMGWVTHLGLHADIGDSHPALAFLLKVFFTGVTGGIATWLGGHACNRFFGQPVATSAQKDAVSPLTIYLLFCLGSGIAALGLLLALSPWLDDSVQGGFDRVGMTALGVVLLGSGGLMITGAVLSTVDRLRARLGAHRRQHRVPRAF